MNDLKQLFDALSRRQKLNLFLAALAVAAGLYYLNQWNRERDLRPLFTGVAPEDAGAVIEKLKSANVDYRVADGTGTILVPSARAAELRLEMASAGLPRTGRIGFEIFDKTSFGATEFSEQVNFRRAIEGELERSVMSLAEVERARVHVTFLKDSVFLESRQPAKASVMVKLRPGARLSPQNVLAISHLTASAVEGLTPQEVAVLDMNGNLLGKPRAALDAGSADASDAIIEYRQAIEKDLRTKIQSTLDPLLGSEKYRAGLSVECDITSGEQSEETFDPAKSVMVNSQKTEDVSGAASPAGVPGTASNLPRPVPKTATLGGGVQRHTESISYQSSRTVKRVKVPQGQVKRLSVAILVDQSVRWEGSGATSKRIIEPPTPEKLKTIRDLVAGTIGLQTDRGDNLIVETLPFEATLQAGPPENFSPSGSPAPQGLPLPAWLNWARPLLEKLPWPVLAGVGAAILLIPILGVIVMLLRRKKGSAGMAEGRPQLAAAGTAPQLQPGESIEDKARAMLAENDAERQRADRELLSSLRMPPSTKKAEALKAHINGQAKQDPVAIAQLVRTWLNEESQ
jgi:flagellar M-ring protein FliF